MTDDLKLPKLGFGNGVASYADQAYHVLRELIIENRLKPGDMLSENDLAQGLGVSRMPVRKALDHLAADGLIRILPKKGSIVEKIPVTGLREICFMRAAVETASIRSITALPASAARRILGKLERNIKAQDKTAEQGSTDTGARFLKLDDDFHATLCQLSGTALAWDTIDHLKANMDRIRYFTIVGKVTKIPDLVAEHRAVYEAVAAGRLEEACELLRSHLYEIGETYKEVKAQNSGWFQQ